jgi:hypothetical protein
MVHEEFDSPIDNKTYTNNMKLRVGFITHLKLQYMTSKEKAKELVDKYVGFELQDYKDIEMGMTLFKAKKNAIICADEILEALGKPSVYEHSLFLILFWNEVKKEIEKI